MNTYSQNLAGENGLNTVRCKMCNLRTFMKFLHIHISTCKINRFEARAEHSKAKEINLKGDREKDGKEIGAVKTKTSKTVSNKMSLNTNPKYGPLPQLMNKFDDVMRESEGKSFFKPLKPGTNDKSFKPPFKEPPIRLTIIGAATSR